MHGSILNAAVRTLYGATTASPDVHTPLGTLRGGVCQSQKVQYFRSIPYAQPPTGDLRFAPPKAYTQKYSDLYRNATVDAPACPQFGGNGVQGGKTSEDCLYINVWKPASTGGKTGLPVRVLVHGDGNMAGGISDAKYDGCNVAEDNVMVSINYRLGPLGFLAIEEAGIDGNQGIQDIVMGLQWVQDNIQAFGGNPKQVALHGQSNGAADAYAVATLEYAPKLMNVFVSQSGAGRDLPSINKTAKASKSFAQALKCDVKDLKCFQRKTLDDISKTYGNSKSLKTDALMASTESGSRLSFGPHIDGRFFAKQPNTVGVKVPAIFGVNADEGTYFAQAYATGSKGIAGTSQQDYEKFLKEHFGGNAKKVEQQYPIANFSKTPFPPYYAISQVITDSAFLCPANRALKAATDKKVPAWTYHFSHKPRCAWDQAGVPEKDRGFMGATHGAELPFVLGMTSQLPRPGGNCRMTDSELKLTAYLKQAITYFAATRTPASNSWSQWSAQKSEGLILDDSVKTGTVNYTVCKFWDDLHEQAHKDKNGGKSKGGDKSKSSTATTATPATQPPIGKPTSSSSSSSTQKDDKPASSTAQSTGSTTQPPIGKPSAAEPMKPSVTTEDTLIPTALGNGTAAATSSGAPPPPPKQSNKQNDPLSGAGAAVHIPAVAAALVAGAMAVVAM